MSSAGAAAKVTVSSAVMPYSMVLKYLGERPGTRQSAKCGQRGEPRGFHQHQPLHLLGPRADGDANTDFPRALRH